MLVIGTGAVASFLVPRLRAGARTVQLFGSPSARLRALSLVPGDAVSEPSRVARHDSWLVLCKTYQNQGRVEALRAAPGPERILVLQNGYRPELDWTGLAGSVERGTLTYGVASVAPGRAVGGEQGEVLLVRGSLWADRLREAGLVVREVDDIRAAVWWKLVVNASLNVVAALGGWPNGQVWERPAARGQARQAALEVAALATRAGLPISQDEAAEALERVATATANNLCSTLVDLRDGRPTEYEAINGALLRLASEYRVETPTLLELDAAFRRRLAASPLQQVAS